MGLARLLFLLVTLPSVHNKTVNGKVEGAFQTSSEAEWFVNEKSNREVAAESRPKRETLENREKVLCWCPEKYFDYHVHSGSFESPNYPEPHCEQGTCAYMIVSALDQAIFLNMESVQISQDSKLRIWQMFYYNGEHYFTLQSEITGQDTEIYEHFVSANGATYRIEFIAGANKDEKQGFKISFEKKRSMHPMECGLPYLVVGTEESIIALNSFVHINSGCVYTLFRNQTLVDEGYEEIAITKWSQLGSYEDQAITVTTDNERPQLNIDQFHRMKYSFLHGVVRNISINADQVKIITQYSKNPVGHIPFPWPASFAVYLRKRTCSCKEEDLNTLNEVIKYVALHMPELPDYHCPFAECVYHNSSETETVEWKEVYIKVQTDLKLNRKDYLALESGNTKILEDQTYEENPFVSSQVVIINVNHSWVENEKKKHYYHGFSATIRRVTIPDECECYNFGEKEYSEDGSISFTIPKSCSYVHCSWRFSYESNLLESHTRVEVSIENPNYGDYVELNSGSKHEKYNATLMKHPIYFDSLLLSSRVSFSRVNVAASTDSIIRMKWVFAHGTLRKKLPTKTIISFSVILAFVAAAIYFRKKLLLKIRDIYEPTTEQNEIELTEPLNNVAESHENQGEFTHT